MANRRSRRHLADQFKHSVGVGEGVPSEYLAIRFTERGTLDVCRARRIFDKKTVKPRTIGDDALVLVLNDGATAADPLRSFFQKDVRAGIDVWLAVPPLIRFGAPFMFNMLRIVVGEELPSVKARHGVPVRDVAFEWFTAIIPQPFPDPCPRGLGGGRAAPRRPVSVSSASNRFLFSFIVFSIQLTSGTGGK